MSDNATSHAPSSTETTVGWVIVPLFLSVIVYMALSLMVWPYARPLMPLTVLLLGLLVPPLFPFLLAYVLVALLCLAPPALTEPAAAPTVPHDLAAVRTATIVIVEPDARGRVRAASPRRGPAGGGGMRSSSSV